MVELYSIGVAILQGASIAYVGFLAFSCAVRARSVNIAPRCAGRNPDTIYNPKATKKKGKGWCCRRKNNEKKEDYENANNGNNGSAFFDYDDDSYDNNGTHVQYRGGPMFGWIPWIMSLSYEQLLKGVPGTGTKNNGMRGNMLKVNLDGIVLIRFHAICLRISVLASFLGLIIILPVNLTARCGYVDGGFSCESNLNLTDFQCTTIENIPVLNLPANVTEHFKWYNHVFGTMDKVYRSNHVSYLFRLYTVVIVSWILIMYSLRILKKEWIDALALRRVFYLERAHWEKRQIEIKESEYGEKFNTIEEEMEGENNRPLNIPHSEHRETVPNIELYSVLVGNIPSQTGEVAYDITAKGKESSADWQLKVTTTFFDQCVPNQPGFSSSVAAVTLLPDAPKLALAWRTWKKHCALLRRLRLVRSLISERKHNSEKCMTNSKVSDDGHNNDGLNIGQHSVSDKFIGIDPKRQQGNQILVPFSTSKDYLFDDDSDDNNDEESGFDLKTSQSSPKKTVDHLMQRRIENIFGVEFKDVANESIENEIMIPQILTYGPEQTAVFAREFAHGASTCCPSGCHEKKWYEMSLIDLEDLEEEFMELIKKSSKRLQDIQQSNLIRNDSQPDISKSFKLQENHVETQLYSQAPTKFSAIINSEKQTAFGQSMNNEKHSIVDDENPSPSCNDLDSSNLQNVLSFCQGPLLTLTNEGKVRVRDNVERSENSKELDNEFHREFCSPELDTSPRSTNTREETESDWQKVQRAVEDHNRKERKISQGSWTCLSINTIMRHIWKNVTYPFKETKEVVDEISSNSTFAVVTFTNRQAAVAARRCLADGRGMGRWAAVQNIPIPPLADASVCDPCDFRGCNRPVTLTTNPKQQFIRKYITFTLRILLYIFWSFPLQLPFILEFPEKLVNVLPGFDAKDTQKVQLTSMLSSSLPGLFTSIILSSAPFVFKALANFGSNAASLYEAEYRALRYYWWFMLFAAFLGTTVNSIIITVIFREEDEERESIRNILDKIAQTLPNLSATWLTWIIVRTFYNLPLFYLLNLWTYLLQCLNWKCLHRLILGGGAGGPVPYRVCIDGGLVFLCVISLTPLSPLLAPAAATYFLFCAPILRRNCIYIYRPIYDSGGIRWPFLANVFLSAICLAQFLLACTMLSKRAWAPGILALLALLPVGFHYSLVNDRYLTSYLDAALLQTSQLDGWDNSLSTSKEEREEFRRFLVDTHKAAYVPICLAGQQASGLTFEPAVVVPHPNDILEPVPLNQLNGNRPNDILEPVPLYSEINPLSQNDTPPQPDASSFPTYPVMPHRGMQRGASWTRVYGNQNSFRRRKSIISNQC